MAEDWTLYLRVDENIKNNFIFPFSFYFIDGEPIYFELKGNQTLLDEIAGDLFGIMARHFDGKDPYVRVSDSIKVELADFSQKYLDEKKDAKSFFQWKNILETKLAQNSFFCFSPGTPHKNSDVVKTFLKDKCDELPIGTGYGILAKMVKPEAMGNYDIYYVDGKKHKKIGQKGASRTCRFCGQTRPNTSFRKRAHTFPEALGNIHILTNDECDKCNEMFGNTIERSLINYLMPMRITACITGKNGSATFIGKDDSSITIDNGFSELHNIDINQRGEFTFHTFDKIVPQNIFRCLCKMLIGVLDIDDLDGLENTLKWIHGDFNATVLPEVFEMIVPHEPLKGNVLYPEIFYYQKKKDSLEAEFPRFIVLIRLSTVQFAFVMPTFDGDSTLSSSDNAKFWDLFHDNDIESWFPLKLLSSKELPVSLKGRIGKILKKFPGKIIYEINVDATMIC